jgi:MoxR-like ATPase
MALTGGEGVPMETQLSLIVHNGYQFQTVFEPNKKAGSDFPFQAHQINGQPAPKLILTSDPSVQPGVPYMVRVESVKKPSAKHHGAIIVTPLYTTLALDRNRVWVDTCLENKIHILLEEGHHILLDGPQGSGKTLLAREIARASGMKFVFFPCSAVFEASDFLATLQLRAGETGPETVWLETEILLTLQEAAENPDQLYLVFLDEFNRMRGQARNGLLPALDATRKLYNPITGGTIGIPDNVRWIAAVNTGDQFVSADIIDPSQLDRFSPLKVGYPPEGEEIKILARLRPDLGVGQIQRVVTAANAVRQNKELGLDLSVRATEEAVIMLANPRAVMLGNDPLLEVLKTSFSGRFQGSWDDPVTDAGQVWETVKTALKHDDRGEVENV